MNVGVVGNAEYHDVPGLLSRLASLASRLNFSVCVDSGLPKRLVRFEKERFFERVRSNLPWGDLSGREASSDAY